MESELTGNQITDETLKQTKGCSGIAALILLSLWIVFLTIITQITNWTIFQVIFEGSFTFPDIRWLIPLIYGILLFIPLVVAEQLVKEPVAKGRIQALRYLSILAVLFSPSRIPAITDWQTTAAIQIAVVILFLIVLLFIKRDALHSWEGQPGLNHFLIAASAGAILGIPWVLWGAQGSSFDTLLALLLCAALGMVIGVVLPVNSFLKEEKPTLESKPRGIWGAGWIVTLGLMILSAAVDQNGNGWILGLSVLPLGFACAALAYSSDGSLTVHGRISSGVLALFGFFWPMSMIDPDELSMVISLGKGELLEYAVKSTALAFGLALLVMLFLYLLRHLTNPGLLFASISFIISWGLIFGLYLYWGQPGFFGEKVFVVMKEQADTEKFNPIADPVERRKAVYSFLVKNAEESQKDIRSWLDSMGARYTPYYLVNGIELYADPVFRAQLAAREDVDRVLNSPMLRPLAEKIPTASGILAESDIDRWNLQMIGAEKVQNELHIYGDGVVIGQSDSGVQGDHPELAASYRGNLDHENDYNWFDPWFGSTYPTDIGGHGTHTLGSILGKSVGVAPGAKWIGCVNLGRNLGNPGFYLDCMQFMLAPFPQKGDPFKDGRPEKGANILNNSWGCPEVEGCDANIFLPAVRALKTAGVFVVVSTGNSGYGGCSTVKDPPAIYEDVYSVGAIDKSGNMAGFSSIGPVNVDGSGRIKPDITAPGVDIASSYPDSTYEIASGTSMAGPHVAGVVALMWSANPTLIGEIDLTRAILNMNADAYTGVAPACVNKENVPNNVSGYGIVNAYKAVQEAINLR
ncbi:MAG: S8 family serine peptidase [Leptolinea sp.]|jgi:subtilisin family serine protease|nr:S8 family serine peptidase [Leptolinea sp.]